MSPIDVCSQARWKGEDIHLLAKLTPTTFHFTSLIAVITCFTAYPICLLSWELQVSPLGQPIAWGLQGWHIAFTTPRCQSSLE